MLSAPTFLRNPCKFLKLFDHRREFPNRVCISGCSIHHLAQVPEGNNHLYWQGHWGAELKIPIPATALGDMDAGPGVKGASGTPPQDFHVQIQTGTVIQGLKYCSSYLLSHSTSLPVNISCSLK